MNSLVSVCIPTYNNLSGLVRLIQSILHQTYQEFEIVITDDSTNDQIENYIHELNHEKIQYIKNTEPLGTPENWNSALSLASGKYIKIMHHDDWFTFHDSLSRYVSLLESNANCAFVFSGSRQVNLSTFHTTDRSISDEQLQVIRRDIRNLIDGNFIGAPSSIMFLRSNLRFDKQLKWLVDIDFYINYLQGAACFLCTKDPLVSIGISDSQVTQTCVNNKQLLCFEYSYEIKKYSLFNNWNIGRHAGLFLLSQGADLKYFLNNGLSFFSYYRTCFERFKQSFNNSLAWFFRRIKRRLEKVFCS